MNYGKLPVKTTALKKIPIFLFSLFVVAIIGLGLALNSLKKNQDVRQQAAMGLLVLPLELQHSPENPKPGDTVTIDFYLNTYGLPLTSAQASFFVKTQASALEFDSTQTTDFTIDYLDIEQQNNGYHVTANMIPTSGTLSTQEPVPIASLTYTPTGIETTELSFEKATVNFSGFELTSDNPFDLDILSTLLDYFIIVGGEGMCQPRPACLDNNPPCNIFYYPPEGWCPTPSPQTGCIRAGCRSELCVDASEIPAPSTCAEQPADACYRTADCGRLTDGSCGHIASPVVTQCLDTFGCIPLPECALPDADPICDLAAPPEGKQYCIYPTGSPAPTPEPSCTPRPECLDSQPSCNLPVPPEGWCPTPSPSPSQTPLTCLQAGEVGGTFLPPNEPLPYCCAGLTETTVLEPSASGCQEIADVFVCTECGNGICGPGENYCNCSSDCGTSAAKIVPKSVTTRSLNSENETVLNPHSLLSDLESQLVGAIAATVHIDFTEHIKDQISADIVGEQLVFTENDETLATLDLAINSRCALDITSDHTTAPLSLSLTEGILSITQESSILFSPNRSIIIDYQLKEGSNTDRRSYAFTTTPTTGFRTDVSEDGIVDIDDYSIFAGELFKTNRDYFYADFDCSGIVDIDDYSIMTSELFVTSESP